MHKHIVRNLICRDNIILVIVVGHMFSDVDYKLGIENVQPNTRTLFCGCGSVSLCVHLFCLNMKGNSPCSSTLYRCVLNNICLFEANYVYSINGGEA